MWCLGTWSSGGLHSVRLTFGIDDLEGLFQPEQFYDSMINVCFIEFSKSENSSYQLLYSH